MAELWGISERTVRNYCANGKIEAYFDHGPTSSGYNRGFRCIYPVK